MHTYVHRKRHTNEHVYTYTCTYTLNAHICTQKETHKRTIFTHCLLSCVFCHIMSYHNLNRFLIKFSISWAQTLGRGKGSRSKTTGWIYMKERALCALKHGECHYILVFILVAVVLLLEPFPRPSVCAQEIEIL